MIALAIFVLIALFAVFAGLVSRWTGFTPFENHLEHKLSKPGENGYLLYSFGLNGKDDEGRWADDQPQGDDIRVRVPLPPLKKD